MSHRRDIDREDEALDAVIIAAVRLSDVELDLPYELAAEEAALTEEDQKALDGLEQIWVII